MKFQEALIAMNGANVEIKRTPWRYNTMRKVNGVLTYFRNGQPSTRSGSNELSLESLTAEDWVTVPLAASPATTSPDAIPFAVPAGYIVRERYMRVSEAEHCSRDHVCSNHDSVFNRPGMVDVKKVYIVFPPNT